MIKKCKYCHLEKSKSLFYKGQGECKECTKKRVKLRYLKLSENEDYMTKERERSREKYHRLGYKNKQKEWDKDKPWKSTQKYKNLHRKFKIPKGFELHHWNYNDEFLEDVFLLEIKEHRKLHTTLTFDKDKLIFIGENGMLLDSREKHFKYLLSKETKF